MKAQLAVTLGAMNPLRTHRTIGVVLDTEFQPEDVFEACNRIGSFWSDLDSLPHQWQKSLRTQLDGLNACSMSVGDYFDVTIDGRTMRHICLPTGWEKVQR